MDECKWNFRLLKHYVRLTKTNKFIILGKRQGQWREVVNINFTRCQASLKIMENKRKSGYYWVNIHSSYGWNIGLYSDFTESWSFLVTKNEWTDDLVIEINEKQILR